MHLYIGGPLSQFQFLLLLQHTYKVLKTQPWVSKHLIFLRASLYFEQAVQTAFGFHVSIAIAFSSAWMYIVHIYQQN